MKFYVVSVYILDGSSTDTALITPCRCKGTLQLVHRNCLERWVRTADTKSCEVKSYASQKDIKSPFWVHPSGAPYLGRTRQFYIILRRAPLFWPLMTPDLQLCHHKFDMTSRLPPFKKWKRLSMSANERKRILMSITFHVIALACVVWSLYVLIGKILNLVSLSMEHCFRKNRRRIEKSWYKMAILDQIGCCWGWIHRWFGLHVCSGSGLWLIRSMTHLKWAIWIDLGMSQS